MKANLGLRVPVFVFAVWAAASAQTSIEPDRLAAVRSAFDSAGGAARLRCDVRAVQPALTYGLQFQTGYVVDVPLNQFDEPGHSLSVFSKVSPEGREPLYFSNSGLVPNGPAAKADAETPGTFVVGEGTYGVEVLVKDDAGRTCYRGWRIQAKPSGSERDLKIFALAGAVEEFSASGPDGSQPQGGPKIEHLTILLHAAAMSPGAAKMEPETIRALTDSLSSLLTQLPAKSVRLAVFSLDKQVVLWKKDSVQMHDLEEVTRAFEQLELAVVDFKTLQNRDKVDVLSDLVAKELGNPKRPSAVVILGPRTGLQTGLPSETEPAYPSHVPWFYLQYQIAGTVPAVGGTRPVGVFPPNIGRGAPGGGMTDSMPIQRVPASDGIESLVRGLSGVTLRVRSPHDLADAIHRMAAEIPPVDVSGEEPRTETPPAPAATLPVDRTDATEATEPTGHEDPVEVLAHLRDRVLEHARSVPNHTCVQTVQRDRYEPTAGRSQRSCDNLLAARKQNRLRLDTTDWLRLDVGMADGREIFSWAGAARFEEGEIDELITDGAFGTGPFATALLAIFENGDPHFIFDGETTLESRRLLQYSFHVPRPESHLRVKAGREWLITGYTGTLMVDPRTSELVRFRVRTEELPAATSLCELDSTLDYNMVSLAGFEYLLPIATRQRFIGVDGAEGENAVSFASCREFQGESTLKFWRTPASAKDPVKAAAGPPLPLGLSMAIELKSPLTLGNAAAGDRIEGRLIDALRDSQTHNVIAPAGARVMGRLTRVELRHTGSGEYTVALRWEGLEVDGEKVTLNLRPNRQTGGLKAVARGVLQQRGMAIELPKPGEERDGIYRFPGQTTLVQGGLRTEWTTTGER